MRCPIDGGDLLDLKLEYSGTEKVVLVACRVDSSQRLGMKPPAAHAPNGEYFVQKGASGTLFEGIWVSPFRPIEGPIGPGGALGYTTGELKEPVRWGLLMPNHRAATEVVLMHVPKGKKSPEPLARIRIR